MTHAMRSTCAASEEERLRASLPYGQAHWTVHWRTFRHSCHTYRRTMRTVDRELLMLSAAAVLEAWVEQDVWDPGDRMITGLMRRLAAALEVTP